MKKFPVFILFLFVALTGSGHNLPAFKASDQPKAPDYADPKYWSALPFRKDAADLIPKNEKWVNDSLKDVDVFYIYPTLYAKGKTWNADADNKQLNKRLDHLPVKYQASIFNRVGRVYAPRYRQANVAAFSDTSGNGEKALDFAYDDIKRAFEYYLKHYNQGRPIIIASHSQGTTHARRLLKDYFDNPEMKAKLICAYAVGFEIRRETYQVLKPCEDASETNCYVTWSTFRDGYEYKGGLPYYGDVCVNPISWKTDTVRTFTKESVLLNVNRRKKFSTEAHISGHHLAAKTNLLFMRHKDILHLVDFNLFWMDVRRNAALRVSEYEKKTGN